MQVQSFQSLYTKYKDSNTNSAVEPLERIVQKMKLDTIKEEAKLCHLYEKMGYRLTGKEEAIQDNMTIVYYAK